MLTSSLRWPAAALASLLLLSPATAQNEIVQSGSVFTGVIEGNASFEFPITLDGYAEKPKLQAVEVTLVVRMSGEYTILPTPVPPNGIVEAHSTTTFTIDKTALGKASISFTPIPWVFPVTFPLNVLWALDETSNESFTDKSTLRSFTSRRPVTMTANVDISTLVKPKGWADPHVAGVFATWEVRYVY